MAVKNTDELIQAVKDLLGDDVGDKAISLIEDLSDTLQAGKESIGEINRRCTEIENAWRKKYIERFGQSEPQAEPVEEEQADTSESITINDLFMEE